jgi:hypothetical protein
MTFFISQSLSQPGRPITRAEQREIDRVNSELVAAFAELGHSVATPWRSLQHALHVSRRRSAMSVRHEPRRRLDAGAVGPVPCIEHPADSVPSGDLVSCSPNRTRQLTRR